MLIFLPVSKTNTCTKKFYISDNLHIYHFIFYKIHEINDSHFHFLLQKKHRNKMVMKGVLIVKLKTFKKNNNHTVCSIIFKW